MTWVFSMVTTCRGPTAPSVSGGMAVKLSASPWNPLKFGIAVAAANGAISGCRAGVADGFAEFRRRTARSGSWLSRCNPSLHRPVLRQARQFVEAGRRPCRRYLTGLGEGRDAPKDKAGDRKVAETNTHNVWTSSQRRGFNQQSAILRVQSGMNPQEPRR